MQPLALMQLDRSCFFLSWNDRFIHKSAQILLKTKMNVHCSCFCCNEQSDERAEVEQEANCLSVLKKCIIPLCSATVPGSLFYTQHIPHKTTDVWGGAGTYAHVHQVTALYIFFSCGVYYSTSLHQYVKDLHLFPLQREQGAERSSGRKIHFKTS